MRWIAACGAVLAVVVAPSAALGASPRFHSAPDLTPPAVHVTRDPDVASGDIFLTPEHGPEAGPMILNAQGQLVWFDPVRFTQRFAAFNLEVQRYQGRPVLTWWRGAVAGESPADVIMNSSYRTVAVIRAPNGDVTDLHEFQITPQGTALIDAHRMVQANLSSLGGPSSATVVDCLVQEINIKTGRLLWQWDSLRHVPLSASYSKPPGSGPYDYFHLNSVQQLPNGNLLISARDTWAVYEISRRTGRIIWTIGGRRSSFKIDRHARFEWQHDARLSGDVLTLFDDASGDGHQEEAQSSGKALLVHRHQMTVTLLARYTHSPPLVTGLEGSMQTLPNHNVFVGWGGAPDFSEYTPDGRQIFNGSFRLGVHSYRAYRFVWHAHPVTRPRLALVPRPGGDVKLWTSWNGATAVARWRVLGGPGPGGLRTLLQRPWAGFETAIKLPDEPRYMAVQALNSSGHILRSTTVQTVPPHLDIFGTRGFVSASTGRAELPVGCFSRGSCQVKLQIQRGQVALGTVSRGLRSGQGALVDVRLSPAGRRELARAPHHRLVVRVMVRDSAGVQAVRDLVLIPYLTRGAGPTRDLAESPALRILGTTQFVSSSGIGGILAACYSATPCPVRATLSARGSQISTSQGHTLGVGEVGYVPFRLTSAGKSLLRSAPGNQLGATVRLTGAGQQASGRLALVAYQ